MTKAVVNDWDGFVAFLAIQPLCRWLAQKQLTIAKGMHPDIDHSPIYSPSKAHRKSAAEPRPAETVSTEEALPADTASS